jgi:hypothetical protein
MITYRCPYCQEPVNIAESEIGEAHDCPNCAVASECPEDAYHKSRLKRLKETQAERSLTADEWREAAIHYRGLGRADRAAQAEKLHRRAIERAARPGPEPLPEPELGPALRWMISDDAVELNRPAGSEAIMLSLGLLLMVTVLFLGALMARGLAAFMLLDGLAALVIAAGCALRGGDCGAAFLAGVLLTPAAGLLYTWVATNPERVEADDAGRNAGSLLCALAGLTWAGIMGWAKASGLLAVWLSLSGGRGL